MSTIANSRTVCPKVAGFKGAQSIKSLRRVRSTTQDIFSCTPRKTKGTLPQAASLSLSYSLIVGGRADTVGLQLRLQHSRAGLRFCRSHRQHCDLALFRSHYEAERDVHQLKELPLVGVEADLEVVASA
jgi:hypothetical protein